MGTPRFSVPQPATRLNVVIPSGLFKRLDKCCEFEGEGRPTIIRRALREFLARWEQENATPTN